MAYIDLNPLRAKMAKSPEPSDPTNVKARSNALTEEPELFTAINELLAKGEIRRQPASVWPLLPLSGDDATIDQARLNFPMHWRDYLQLIGTSGRIAAQGIPGRIDPSMAPVPERLGLTDKQWLAAASGFRMHYRGG